MQKAMLFIAVLLASAFIAQESCCETLTVIDELSHTFDSVGLSIPIGALLLGGDSIMYVSLSGLFARFDSLQSWRKIIDCVPHTEAVPFSVCDRDELERLIFPDGLWRVSGEDGDEILVLEGFCSRLYSLRIRDGRQSYLRIWRKKMREDHSEDYCQNVNVQGNLILSALGRFASDKAVALQYTDKSDYRRVFDYPEALTHHLDSIGRTEGDRFCIPAFNPTDSTLWLAIYAYDYLYIIDMEGQLLDSLQISAPDYRVPPPIKSRIKSNAVWTEWMSHWTPLQTFSYVPPGYFLMQYHVGSERQGKGKGIRLLYSTVVWDVDRRPVPLEVNKYWRLVGVHDDGRIVFGHREIRDDTLRVVLTIARIEP